MISCVLSLWLTYFDGTTSSLGNNIPEPKAQDCFLRVLCGLTNGIQFVNKFKWQEIFSVVGQYLDALICHEVFKDLSFWKSYQLASSAIRSDIQYIDSKCNEEALYSICEQYLHACWDEEEVIFVQYTHSTFFFSQCAFSEMVFSSWYSSYGWHLQSPLKAASVRTWSAIFRAIQIVGTF